MIKNTLPWLNLLLLSGSYSYSADSTRENQLHIQLIDAVRKGNKDEVQALIKAQVDVNKTEKKGTTALWIAAENDHHNIAELLIQSHADTNLAKNNGATPLYIAAKKGHHKIAELLTQNRADTNLAKNNGIAPLWVAAEKNHQEMVELLIKAQADVNSAEKDGVTALLVATQNDHHNIAQLLTQNRADTNLAKNNRVTALWLAAQNGHHKIAQLLTESRADTNMAKNNGATPLYVAAQNGHLNIAELLTESRADIDMAKNNGATPLYVAAQNGHLNIVKLFIKFHANVNPTYAYKPLDGVILYGSPQSRIQMIEILIDGYLSQLQRLYSLYIVESDEITMEIVPNQGVCYLATLLSRDIIESLIIPHLSPQDLAMFRLTSKGCRALTYNERSKQKVRNYIHHDFNNFIESAITVAKNKGGLNAVAIFLQKKIKKEYIKKATLKLKKAQSDSDGACNIS